MSMTTLNYSAESPKMMHVEALLVVLCRERALEIAERAVVR